MEISGVAQNAQTNNELINSARAADLPTIRTSQVSSEQVRVPAVERPDFERMDEKRLNDIKRTIERNSFRETFAVSDQSFTIFKDQNGQYITRFTDLRDGSVTYVPEPEILSFNGGSDIYVELDA